MIDVLHQIFSLIFGLAMVFGLLIFIYKRDAVDWEKLQAAYSRDWLPPEDEKKFATVILYSDGRMAKSYKGLLTLGLYPHGIGLRPSRILLPFQYPIYVPYEDIEGWHQNWFIDGASTEIAFRKTPGMRMIMPKSQLDWIQSKLNIQIPVSKQKPPHGKWPAFSFIHAVVMGVLTVGLICLLLFKYFTGAEF